MKNILIITAHPSSLGHTHIIANTYKEESEKLGATVTVLDLYKEENYLPYYSYEDIRNYEHHPNVAKFQTMITEASEVVIVHPLWWGGAPAILKNFIDQVFITRFAYQFTKEGERQKLLGGRDAKVFITAGGPAWIYLLMVIPPFKLIWKYITLEYCGMKVTDFKTCYAMSLKDDKESRFQRFLEKVRRSARK